MIKNIGIKRQVDELGRIVIPVEIRKKFNINIKDELEIFINGKFIMLKKYEKNCIFCDSEQDILEFEEHVICKRCLEKLQNIKK